MEYFLVKPNYRILSKHYAFKQTEEEFERTYKDGYGIIIEPYLNNGKLKFAGEHIQEVERGFKTIVNKYDLSEHYDNLFFLCLSKLSEVDQILFHLEDDYAYKKRAKELAQLLLAFKETDENQFSSLNLKTLKHSAKISDKKLLNWIGDILINAIDNEEEPIYLFGLTVHELLRGSTDINSQQPLTVDQLKKAASVKVSSSSFKRKKYIPDFCFYLYPYLINETTIKPDKSTLVSDKQLNFYFDVLVLLEMLNPDDIDSDPKDYMRTVLKNRIKELNPSLSRK